MDELYLKCVSKTVCVCVCVMAHSSDLQLPPVSEHMATVRADTLALCCHQAQRSAVM